jgi:prephenate dehydrogenase
VLIGERRKAALLERLVAGVGARPTWMKSPRDHDLKVARVSHIPYLLAYALMGTPADAIRVCGNSFRDATRVAASDPDMVLDFLLTNAGPIRRSGGELQARLNEAAPRHRPRRRRRTAPETRPRAASSHPTLNLRCSPHK